MTTENVDLFGGDSTPQDNPGPQSEAADLFATLVGEGKKFKSPQDLAKSRLEADKFIEQLKSENAEMRRELEKASKVGAIDEALNRLNDRLEKASGDSEEGVKPTAMSREDILAIVREDTLRSKWDQNRKAIQAELVNKLGEASKARDYLSQKSAELGMSLNDLRSIVEKSPAAARNLLGLGAHTPAPGPTPLPPNSRNTEAIAPTVGVRNKAYYDNLRKEMGTKFWTPSIQTQMFKDREAMGENFYK